VRNPIKVLYNFYKGLFRENKSEEPHYTSEHGETIIIEELRELGIGAMTEVLRGGLEKNIEK